MTIATATSGGMVVASAPRYMLGVTDDELDVVRRLVDVWAKKYARNVVRSAYYDGKVPFQHVGIIPPEAFGRMRAVLDWPEKAVSALAERSVFEGYVTPGNDEDPFELRAVLDDNRFDLELPQAIASAYKHSCSFITTALGDTAAGEPPIVVMARSAEWSAALWDEKRRMVVAALAITSLDDDGAPDEMSVYLPDVVLMCVRRPSGAWVADRQPNPLGEVLVEPLTYDPQLNRPFGRSRISRPVMDITDRALRTILRTEVSAEFYAAPRMFALGVAEDAFARGKWKAAIDRWFAITKDEDGDTPTVGQFPQMTMQPLSDLYRMYATQFSGATGLPVSSLGIVQDNPPSAEALYADDRRLVATAKRQNRVLASSLRRVAQRIVRLRDGADTDGSELQALSVSWAKPEFISPGSAADALVKLATVFPWIGESEVALEMAGFTGSEITRLLADKRRAQGGANLQSLLASVPEPTTSVLEADTEPQPSETQQQAADLKTQFDALGIAIRAGVDPADAASRLGLAGIRFTGAVPVALRMPQDEARGLEEK